jgi:Glycosyl-4,4'-diaponeurosporenoate acyltransferase
MRAQAHHGAVRRVVVVLTSTGVAAVLLAWSYRAFGPRSLGFAFVVVWLPMVWLGTISHLVAPRLPDRWHRLRPFEADGRAYERLGVRTAKRLLRRGPFAVFNPGLHLPEGRTDVELRRLDQKMRDAEASHAILLVLTLGIVLHAAARGWWVAAIATLVFDVLVNGYPVMLQRYNRALLDRRFGASTRRSATGVPSSRISPRGGT